MDTSVGDEEWVSCVSGAKEAEDGIGVVLEDESVRSERYVAGCAA